MNSNSPFGNKSDSEVIADMKRAWENSNLIKKSVQISEKVEDINIPEKLTQLDIDNSLQNIAFSKYDTINSLTDNKSKHREWLKDYEGLYFSIGEKDREKVYWKEEKEKYIYSDKRFSEPILCVDYTYRAEPNKIQRHPNRLIVEFDGDKNINETRETSQERLMHLKDYAKSNGWGFIHSTHNSINGSDYLWFEFSRTITDKEAERFLKFLGDKFGGKIDINFASSDKRFPVLYAQHWKYPKERELPLEYFKGSKINFDYLTLPNSKGKIVKKIKNGRKYSNYIGDNLNLSNIDDVRMEVLEELGKIYPDRRRATEIMSMFIQHNERIYTTRSDVREEVWIYKEGIYTPDGETYIREICRTILGMVYTSTLSNEVIEKIKVDTFTDAESFFIEKDIEHIPVKNGLLNIFTGKLKPFDENVVFFTKVPVFFDETKTCNNISKFFKSVVEHKEDVPILEELFGYCLLRDYRIQKAFMFNGSGSNGKSRVLEILRRFLGVENCVGIELQEFEKDTFVMSLLFGKLANISADMSDTGLEASGNFKKLTGGDLITANRKFKIRIKFVNYSKQIYSANTLPRTSDLTDAFFRRWIILNFPFKFCTLIDYKKLTDAEKEEKIDESKKYQVADTNIIEKILTDDELSGLLNLSLVGLKRLLKNDNFSYSKTTDEIRNTWIRKSNSFHAFCLDKVTTADNTSKILKSEIRKIYNTYCTVNKLKPVPDKVIHKTLIEEYGASVYQDFDGKRERYWEGIKWK